MRDAQETAAPGRRTVVAIVAAMIAVPALYVAANYRTQPGVLAAQVPAAQAGRNAVPLPELEHIASSDPTAAHRLNLSQAYIDTGMTARAIGLLNALVADEPRNALAWNNLCVAHTLQQELNAAINACETGVRNDGSLQLLKNNLRWAQDEKAKTLAALAEEERTAPAERTAGFYLVEGLNHLHLGEYDEALRDWQHSAELDPRSAAAQNNIGMAQMLLLHYAAAEASFRKAISLDPSSQLARNNLAWAQQEQLLARH